MDYRKLRKAVIDMHWNNNDPKVDRVCKKLSKKVTEGQQSKLDSLSDMYLKTYQ